MARYRRNAFLKKLATTTLARSTFVLAQILGRGSLVTVQAALLLVVAIAGFGLRPTLSGALSAALVCVLGLFVFSGIGFALASLIETEAVVSDVISGLTPSRCFRVSSFRSTPCRRPWSTYAPCCPRR
jgi:ABC-type multidrug transport system permease subunit